MTYILGLALYIFIIGVPGLIIGRSKNAPPTYPSPPKSTKTIYIVSWFILGFVSLALFGFGAMRLSWDGMNTITAVCWAFSAVLLVASNYLSMKLIYKHRLPKERTPYPADRNRANLPDTAKIPEITNPPTKKLEEIPPYDYR